MASLESTFGRPRGRSEGGGTHWLSVSDLMAGLMMVFMFIAIALMHSALGERDRIREIAVAYQDNQVAIYDALMEEFVGDLERWDAAIDQESLSFEFRSPDVLFAAGETEIRPEFQDILDEFFPRYVNVLKSFQDSVDEIRIEGHTSSDWTGASTAAEAYFLNMTLSQGRTRSVLRYVFDLAENAADRRWVQSTFAAVGFSSSRLILDDEGREDRLRSRRVTFRVITNAEIQIKRIIETP